MVTANIMNFRYINALFGVLKGNEALVRTGATMRRIAEESSGLCGRLGADQFAMLVPQAMFREEHLLDAAQDLAEAFNSGIYTFHIHFGVYEVGDPSIPVSVMCGRANTALRTIRESLKKTIAYFDEAMQRKSLFEQEVISGFEDALRDGQFRIYLQPLVGENNVILGAEALVRWCRPDGTIIFPGDFIETLEHTGLIHELDVYIWEQAVRQLSFWRDTDKGELTISVNMSTKDFFNVDVYQVLTGLVEKYGVDSRMLRLEITETALLEDTETTNSVVEKLRNEGFLVEIDDFGKGYSSLVMLKDIHADVLKIDMSLLHEIETNPRNKVILEAVIAMANGLGMEVITEGVETEEQMNVLAAMGCHYYQGYFFSRPVPVDEFEELCRP
jgi:EAL domain-containing protein (putative c-di-GMP-specific phosphodiesterase class I)